MKTAWTHDRKPVATSRRGRYMGYYLHFIRRRASLTLHALADRSGLSVACLSALERGGAGRHWDHTETIATELGHRACELASWARVLDDARRY